MVGKIVATIATTAPVNVADSQIRFTTDALLGAADTIGCKASAPMGLEHDPYTVPVMKSGRAWVEFGDDFDSLAMEILESEQFQLVTQDTETEYVFLRFPTGSLPLSRCEHSDYLSVSADLANFDTADDLRHFEGTVSQDGTRIIHMGRYSVGPEPIIALSGTVVTGLILLLLLKPFYTGYSSAVSKLSEQLIINTVTFFAKKAMTALNEKTNSVLVDFLQHKSVDDRPILVERELTNPELNLKFLERTDEHGDLRDLELREILETLQCLGNIVSAADQIKLLRDDKGKWQLWYLHTKDGHVIATDEAMAYTSDVLARLKDEHVERQNPVDLK